jgi:hypothetical protein
MFLPEGKIIFILKNPYIKLFIKVMLVIAQLIGGNDYEYI